MVFGQSFTGISYLNDLFLISKQAKTNKKLKKERHCNENALKTAFLYRQRGLIPATNHSSASNALINYSKDAALMAIQRNQKMKREDFFSPEEGPITKSIRLLSALTLRNLAKNSEKAKT